MGVSEVKEAILNGKPHWESNLDPPESRRS